MTDTLSSYIVSSRHRSVSSQPHKVKSVTPNNDFGQLLHPQPRWNTQTQKDAGGCRHTSCTDTADWSHWYLIQLCVKCLISWNRVSHSDLSLLWFGSNRLLLCDYDLCCLCDRSSGWRARFGQGRDRHGQSQPEMSRACTLSVCRHWDVCQGNPLIILDYGI